MHSTNTNIKHAQYTHAHIANALSRLNMDCPPGQRRLPYKSSTVLHRTPFMGTVSRGRWGKLNQIWGSEYCELRATSRSKPSRVIRSILTFLLRNRWNWDICKYSELTIYTVSSSEIKIFCDLSQIETKLPLRVCLSEHLNLCVTKVLHNVLFCNSI